MRKKINKLMNTTISKVVLGMVLAIILTTSVFAATGALNQRTTEVVTQEQVQDHIKDEVIRQLEAKINELLQSGDSDISQKVASKLNEQAILDQLRAQIEEQIGQYANDLDFSQIDKIIEETIDRILDSIINETVKVAIDNAIANANIDGSFSVDEALRATIETEVTNQINKIIMDNVDSIITETIDKVIVNKPSTETKPTEPSSPTNPSEPSIPTQTEDKITLSKDKVIVDPSSAYNGKSLQEFLSDKATELNLQSHDTEYGLYIDNINNLITNSYHAKLKDNQLIRYDYYISFDINNQYAQTGIRDTIITENDIYTFTAQDYEQGDIIAEVLPYQAGNIPYQIDMWGHTQSNEFPALVLKTYTSIDGSQESKVEDMISLLGINLEVSSTGYTRITYKNLSWSRSEKLNNLYAFVPSIYKMTSETKMSYAKGMHPSKSNHEMAQKDTTQTYYFAQEWDGYTPKTSVNFE